MAWLYLWHCNIISEDEMGCFGRFSGGFRELAGTNLNA
jgi:hypothetical protein